MATYGKASKDRLSTAHQDLQTIFHYVVKHFDNTIVCGERTEEAQNKAFNDGFSQVKFPNSKHNSNPSMAVDSVPYPIEWNNVNRMRVYAGFVLGIARMLKDYGDITHELRWGGDWDSDTILKDQRFNDFPHFELK